MNSIEELGERYESYCQAKLNLNLSRGKPSSAQLDLANPMLSCLQPDQVFSELGIDCRNYGILDGLPEVRRLFSSYLEVPENQIVMAGNASLNLMYDTIVRALLFPLPGQSDSWRDQGTIKFLCPVPGYDRHFGICEALGIEMIPINLTGQGPNINEIEALVTQDPAIKGIWCVPKYSNPTGETYSDEVVDYLANMKTAASDFRIFWDNAYAFHDLEDETTPLKNILSSCEQANHHDRVFMFASTSKISFAGSGLAMLGASPSNISWAKHHMQSQTIGYDKLNQLRHLRFFKDLDGIKQHMKKHQAILRPKFECVDQGLKAQGIDSQLATWTRPKGGYFISLNTRPGMAKQVVHLAKEAGVQLTPAGSTFPYFNDPLDQNIRIAPSFPSLEELTQAIEILATCIHLAGQKCA